MKEYEKLAREYEVTINKNCCDSYIKGFLKAKIMALKIFNTPDQKKYEIKKDLENLGELEVLL